VNQFLKDRLLKYKSVSSVEMYQRQGEVYYHYAALEMSKGEMNINEQALDLTWDALVERLNPSTPLVLVLNLRGILHKKLAAGIAQKQLISHVLPNANSNDFYLQSVPADEGQVVSIVRKDQINQWIKPFEMANFWLLEVRLGSFDGVELLPFIREKGDLSTSIHDLYIVNDTLNTFKKSSEQYEKRLLGDEYIDTRLLPSIGSAFRLLVQTPANELGIDSLTEKQKEYYQFKLFQTGGWTILIVFFLTLLVNFLLFSSYNKKNQTLNGQLIYHQTALDKLDSLKRQTQSQSTFFQESNLTKSSKTSFYADRIAASMPYGIQLTELNIYPRQKNKDRAKEVYEFASKQIIIKGEVNSSIIYNDWKRQLNNLAWTI
jgi:Tfp pilus assembly protein PilN